MYAVAAEARYRTLPLPADQYPCFHQAVVESSHDKLRALALLVPRDCRQLALLAERLRLIVALVGQAAIALTQHSWFWEGNCCQWRFSLVAARQDSWNLDVRQADFASPEHS